MVKIIEYQFEKEYLDRYAELIRTLYTDYVGVGIYSLNIQRLLSQENPFFKENKIWNFLALEDNIPVGHVSAILDYQMMGKKIGILGFFECVENKELFKELLESAIRKLKLEGCQTIIAPINLTIWHGYRFALEQDIKNVFYFEPLSKKYYDSFFTEEGFVPAEEYYSAERTDFSSIISLTENDYKRVIAEGYCIRPIDLNNLPQELNLIYNLSKEVFNISQNYRGINKEEFSFIYSNTKNIAFPELIEIIVNPSGEGVGFCFSVPDPFNPNTLIMKTLAVKDTERRKGLGAALLHSQHLKAKKLGFNKLIYALIREENTIKKLPYPDARIISKYRTYKKTI